jgi:hypothetical protein
MAGVTVTPEVAVFLPDRTRVYRGRIDNWYESFGRARPQPTERDLSDVLQAILAGPGVAPRTTKAIGCYIPALE